ncbi:MAG: PKD domain-containing protein [Ilumatobacter sp.]
MLNGRVGRPRASRAPRTLLVAFAMVASAMLAVVPSVNADAERVAVLVMKSATSPTAPDQVVADRLESLGFVVRPVDDDAVGPDDATGADVIVITTTVSASKVGSVFTSVDVPVLAWEPGLFDDLGFHGSSDSGQSSSTTKIRVSDSSHPIAAGATGDVGVTSSAAPLSWSRPDGDVQVIAIEPFGAARAVVFAYEVDAQMHELVAPARRVGFFPTWSTPSRLTEAGFGWFDRSIEWLTSGPAPTNAPPIVDAGEDRVVAPGVPVDLAGEVTDDGRPDGVLTISWSEVVGVDYADPTSASTSVTFAALGVYELVLAADDGEFSVTDTVEITVTDEASPPPPEVLWVTSGASAPAAEVPGIERLQSSGAIVTVRDDDQAEADDAAGMDLVIITSRVSPSKVKATFADAEVPVMIWEPYLYDDMGFNAGGGVRGQVSGQRSVRVIDEGPLGAGLSDVATVLASNQVMSWAVPSGEALVVARLTSSSTRATVFAYEAGAMMHDEPAPARRLGYFLGASGPTWHNDNGWAMWDAAVNWLLDGPDPAPDAVATATPATVGVAVPVTFDGSQSTDNGTITEHRWDFGDGTSMTGEVVQHAYSSVGTYVASLEVTDEQGSTDTATVEVTVVDEPDGWAGGTRPFRVSLTVAAGGHDRTATDASAVLDVADLFAAIGATDPSIDPASIRVVRVDVAGGEVLDSEVVFQFDPVAGSGTAGELLVRIDAAAAGSTQVFDVYFDRVGGDYTSPTFGDAVVVSAATDEQRPSTRFATPAGEWYFDPAGGGFSSLVDLDARDWIGWNTAAGSSGEFRGIPNAVFPDRFFRPGADGHTSVVVADGPLRATIETTSPDGRYLSRWDVYGDRAEMEMVQADGPYWFLYEGTPGGSFNGAKDRLWRPDGSSITVNQSFLGDLLGEEWVYFSDPFVDRSLMVAHVDNDDIDDRYFSLGGNMTVFGFGRGDNLEPRLTTPERFVVGLLDGADFTVNSARIRGHVAPMAVGIGGLEVDGGE